MDGVSTAWSLVSSGYKVFKKVKALRKAVKDAPEKLQSIEDSCILLEQLLENLRRAESHLPVSTNAQPLTRLSGRAQRGFDEVEKIIDKVTKGCLDEDEGVIELKISRIKWIWYKEDLEDIERELNGLRDILSTWTQQTTLEIIIINTSSFNGTPPTLCGPDSTPRNRRIRASESDIARISEDQNDDCSAASSPTVAHDRARSKDPLRCPPQCKCRCHHPSIVQLIPGWLASYTGQVSISKRLLHPTFWSWLSLCNVQTCRGDLRRSMSLRWSSPLGLLHGSLQYIAGDRQIQFSLHAPRTVSWYSPLTDAIFDGDTQGVRDLFATGKASIWDYTIDGLPVVRYACEQWQRNPIEERLQIIRLFIEAGAETLLFEEAENIYSAHDTLTMGFFTYLLGGTSDESQSLATVVRTNRTAIDIFCSILNINPMDALEDHLDRYRAQYTDVTGFMASLEDTRCNSESRSSVFQVINYSPLQYAIYYSPESVESLLADGEDATAAPTLIYAVGIARPELIRPLLDAGADVNMKNWLGHTALLEACSWCFYYEFFELLRWAEDDIDWEACAPDGRNALELFDSAVSARKGCSQWPSQSYTDEFRAALVAHMRFVEDVCDERLDIPGAFPDAP